MWPREETSVNVSSQPCEGLRVELGAHSVQRYRHEYEVVRQIHDANIVATMRAHYEPRLLTFNPTDFHPYTHRIELVDHSQRTLVRLRTQSAC